MRIYVHIKPNQSPAGVISEVQLPAERFGIMSNSEKVVTAFRVSVSSAPIDGKANDELIKIIAKHFDTPKSKIAIVRGLKGRFKVVEIS